MALSSDFDQKSKQIMEISMALLLRAAFSSTAPPANPSLLGRSKFKFSAPLNVDKHQPGSVCLPPLPTLWPGNSPGSRLGNHKTHDLCVPSCRGHCPL